MARGPKETEIIGKLREAEILSSRGMKMDAACRKIGVTEQTYYRLYVGKPMWTSKTDQGQIYRLRI